MHNPRAAPTAAVHADPGGAPAGRCVIELTYEQVVRRSDEVIATLRAFLQ
jgi:hypothetical protein